MKIGILQTGLAPAELASKTGEYPDMFERLLGRYGFDFQTWSVVNGEIPDSVEEADGWLITGSRHGAYEDHAWIPPLEEFIRAAHAAGRPMVGVCFGHQIMAQAMGGKVEKFDGGWAVGPQRYDFPDGPMVVNAWHQDQVVAAPGTAQVVAGNAFCRNAALLYPGWGYSVQPHPEFDDAFLEGLITHRAPGVVPDDRIKAANAALGQPLDRDRMGAQIARFFKTREIA